MEKNYRMPTRDIAKKHMATIVERHFNNLGFPRSFTYRLVDDLTDDFYNTLTEVINFVDRKVREEYEKK